MKNIRKAITILFLLCTCLYPQTAYAQDAGYHYESLYVTADINSKREYHITETMMIDFEEEMHGILRSIPKSSDTESYEVEDIQVIGMPFDILETSDEIEVRIGDTDTVVQGLQEITLQYTLKHYQDYDSSYDYVYLNLLGTDYDTEVLNFQAAVNFPSREELLAYRIRSGTSGTVYNSYVDETWAGNTLLLKSRKTLPAYCGVTVQAKYPQGMFADAPEFYFPYTIQETSMHIEITTEQEYLVQQTTTIDAENTYTPVYLPLISQEWEKSYQIRDFHVAQGEAELYHQESIKFYPKQEGLNTIVLSYTIHPNMMAEDTLLLSFFDEEERTKLLQFDLQLTMPYAPDAQVDLRRGEDSTRNERFQLTAEDAGLMLSTQDRILNGEHFRLYIPVKEGVFHRDIGSLTLCAVIVSGLLVLLILFLRLVVFRNKKPIAPITFYPPKGMNPAEAGYIIDMKLRPSDITSIIFHWADKGYLHITDIDGSYSFQKLKEPVDVPAYERQLFRDVFAHGKQGIVTKKELQASFHMDVRKASRSIKEIYSKDKALQEPSVEKLRILCIFSSAIPILLINSLTIYDIYRDPFRAIVINLITLPLFMFTFLFIKMYRKMQDNSSHRLSSIIAIVFFIIIIMIGSGYPRLFMPFQSSTQIIIGIGIVSYLLILTAAYGIHKNTAYRDSLLPELLGFRDFIKTAEKDRLEMLLQDDPAYYYHILPYAQVLHVSDIWSDKFSSIAMEPPVWYTGSSTFQTSSFQHSISSIHKDMRASSLPKSSHSGSSSSFSGGGGGFSSGGRSGGGSGGGGSRGW